MTAIELLRFDWSRTQGRLLLAALADAGPVSVRAWAVRSGVPRNHVLPTIAECERLGALKQELRAEGIVLLVQPVEFWRVTPLADAAAWSEAWRNVAQERLDLVTEARSLAEAMASMRAAADGKGADRNPVGGQPESGKADRNPIGVCTSFAGTSSETFRRSDVLDQKRITSKRGELSEARDTSPQGGEGEERSARSGDPCSLQERVRLFVGERDWRRYWEQEEPQAIFADAQRAAILRSSLRYCQAALKEGVQVRKNTGAMLWEDYKRALRKVICGV